ncbi:MAG: DUF420 domain-containing protein [Ignavibacteriales bacterium]|nr:DUF420 domain-containing protein [Ignavibacteriales bacterium]
MLDFLPTLNALLNATCATLLIIGRRQIKSGNRSAHKKYMLAAFTTSVLFFISYLTFHYFHGSTKFAGEGFSRTIYFSILLSHTILATGVPILSIITLRFGLLEKFASHKKIARWTYPVWLYVSATGVIIYVMLYHLQ